MLQLHGTLICNDGDQDQRVVVLRREVVGVFDLVLKKFSLKALL